jgi:hypothetical protein
MVVAQPGVATAGTTPLLAFLTIVTVETRTPVAEGLQGSRGEGGRRGVCAWQNGGKLIAA